MACTGVHIDTVWGHKILPDPSLSWYLPLGKPGKTLYTLDSRLDAAKSASSTNINLMCLASFSLMFAHIIHGGGGAINYKISNILEE